MKKVESVNIEDEYISIGLKDTITEVAKKMTQADVPDAIVLDEAGKVVGVLDDYDIVSKIVAEEKNPNEATAEDAMYAPPLVKLSTTLDVVEDIMLQFEASILPVVDEENKLLGVISMRDVHEAMRPKGLMAFLRR